jgi:hypothetical protein
MESRFHRWEVNARGPSESAQAIRFSELAARNPVVERPPRNIEPFSRFLYPDDLTIQYLIDCFSHGLKILSGSAASILARPSRRCLLLQIGRFQ